MKIKITTFLAIVLSLVFFSFSFKTEIKDCYLSYKGSKKLTAAAPDRLPQEMAKPRKVKTEDGEVEISVTDGYRIFYNNEKKAPFVNLKVELSVPASYGKDTMNVLANLKYLNATGVDMETKDLIELRYNGYKITGLSRKSIEKGSTLGIFVIFPGKNTIFYFYFNNLTPEFRTFKDLDEYKGQRNSFLGNYTDHLKNCKDK